MSRKIVNVSPNNLLEYILYFLKKLVALSFTCLTISGCATLTFAPNNLKYEPNLPNYNHPNIALVLGSGGAKGLAHVAIIEELELAGIKPDLIVGCSAGSIVGAMYADGKDIKDIKALLLQGRREQFIDFSLINFPFGILSGDSLNKFLKQNIKSNKISELKIPFIATATNLQYGNLTAFGQGLLLPAIKASAAYPGMFYPVKIGGNYFVDGGVANPVPVEIAKKAGAKFIIAVDISESLTTDKPGNLFGIVKRSFEISYLHQSRLALHEADFIIKVPFIDTGSFTDDKNHEIYRLGKNMIQKEIQPLKEALKTAKVLN